MLTSDMLFDAAMNISPDPLEMGTRGGPQNFMCFAVEDAGGNTVTFCDMLAAHGVSTEGSLRYGYEARLRSTPQAGPERQALRFMFLLFLAHSLEE